MNVEVHKDDVCYYKVNMLSKSNDKKPVIIFQILTVFQQSKFAHYFYLCLISFSTISHQPFQLQQRVMSNKLEEMKKRLLSNKPSATLSDQKIESQTKSAQLQEQNLSKNIEVQQLINQPSQLIKENNNLGCLEQQNISSPSRNPKVTDKPELLSLDIPNQDKKKPEKIQICHQEELQSGELKKTQQSLLKKNQETCNLELVDKNPFFSYSVDEEIRGSMNNLAGDNEKVNLLFQMDSKQQKKQQKIVLKQLQIIKESIRNLKSSIKGLERLENMIAADPKIKTKVKLLLHQMSQAMNKSSLE